MPRGSRNANLHRCVNPFAIVVNGVWRVYAAGDEVLDSDPILKTHGDNFEPAAERVLARSRIEQTTADPGEYRAPTPAPSPASFSEES